MNADSEVFPDDSVPINKYNEKYIFERSHPRITDDRKSYELIHLQPYWLLCFILVCQQLQLVIDSVRVLRLNNLNLQVYFPNGLLEVSKRFQVITSCICS